jgi:hypothetical protein
MDIAFSERIADSNLSLVSLITVGCCADKLHRKNSPSDPHRLPITIGISSIEKIKGTRTTHSNAQREKKAKNREREREASWRSRRAASVKPRQRNTREQGQNKQTDEFWYSIDLTFGGRR